MKLSAHSLYVLLPLAAVGLIFSLFFKFDYNIKTPSVIEPSKRVELRATYPGGFVDKLCVEEGQRVKQGAVVAVLTNISLERAIAEQHTQIATLEKQLVEASGRRKQNEVNQVKAQQEEAQKVAAKLEATRDDLTLRAPFSGTVLIPEESKLDEKNQRRDVLKFKKGSYARPGETICSVSNTDEVTVYTVVHDSDIAQVEPPGENQPGAKVTLRMYAYPDRTFTGAVYKKPQAYNEFIKNPALLHPFGGEVVVKQSGEPVGHFFVVNISIANPEGLLIPGMTGWARIHAGKKTLADRSYGFVRKKIRLLFRAGS